MNPFVTVNDIDQAAQAITKKIKIAPQVALVLGSGLGGLADEVVDPVVISYSDLPNWPVSTIHGHAGRLVIGSLAGVPVMVMQGRAHYYEGYTMDHVTLPIRVMQRMKFGTIFLSNAAGAINPDYQPGDVMALNDHIGLIGMAGLNPLRGPNLDEFGERFPDMSQVYDRDLLKLSAEIAKKKKITLHQGVYVCLSGPSFESPADLRFLRGIGADAVGMSTVPEAIVARHGRSRVLAFSGISNKANLDGNTETTHEEVLAAGSMIVPKLTTLIKGVLESIGA
ncbi:MAG: purine-nucleoside phosphorylase [Anaerolineaceae bacterium]